MIDMRYSELVYLADGLQSFVRQIEAVLAEKDPNLALRRRAIAKEESWWIRCLELERRLGAD